jgi:iron complex outermembrane receptor protein
LHQGRRAAAVFAMAAFAVASPGIAGAQQFASISDLSRLSIEELANLEVESVSRRPEQLSEAPAAVFVITNDDIRRSGATSVAEALRLAPNLQVARSGSSTYAITARGFNHSTNTANKLLVLIDGRIVYTPLYSGVFWDVQNLVLDDIDHIEVISGPGGTLWGANAVNGVINIVTKSSRETQGVLVNAGIGSEEKSASLRYGGTLGNNASFRAYVLAFERGDTLTPAGTDAGDSWNMLQGGFRVDWRGTLDDITVQGDIYSGSSEDVPGAIADNQVGGGNLLARWARQVGRGLLQGHVYYDRTDRSVGSGIEDAVNTYAGDAQYHLPMGAMHDVVFGGDYRVNDNSFKKGPATAFLDPADKVMHVGSVFAQDEIAFTDSLALTLGIKFEHNSYTGWEYMPNARLAWHPSDAALFWGAVSRAVRTPARFDRDLFNTGLIAGGPNFESEDLIAYELGYRGQPSPVLSLSVTGFIHDYDHLRSTEATTPFLFPFILGNKMEGEVYGVEVWGNLSLTDWWRLSFGGTTLHKDLRLKPGSRDVFGVAFAGNDPEYQLTFRSLMNISDNVELNIRVRAIDALASPAVPAYIEAETRIGWHVTDALELWLAGSNLLDDSHLEFASSQIARREIERAVYAGIRWRR